MTEASPASAEQLAAQRTRAAPVLHAAWGEARNALLELAALGPATVALVGAPGIGKSWMLRDLAACLGEQGFSTTMLMQGDLPYSISDDDVLLIDETLRMPEATLDRLLAQRLGFVVLADVERLATLLGSRPVPPLVIAIRPLTETEVADFAESWLQQKGLSAAIFAPGAFARLVVHAGGTVRLVTQLLGVAVGMHERSGRSAVSGADIDFAALMRQDGLSEPELVGIPKVKPAAAVEPVVDVAETAAPAPKIMRFTPKRRVGAAVLATTAIAAGILLGWALQTRSTVPAQQPAPKLAALPPLQTAEMAAPALAAQSTPAPARLARAELAATASPPVTATATATASLIATTFLPASGPVIVPASAPVIVPAIVTVAEPVNPASPVTALTAPSPPAPLTSALDLADTPTSAPPPAIIANTEPLSPPSTAVPATAPTDIEPTRAASAIIAAPAREDKPSRNPRRGGGPGIVLLAQRGDTLQSMYRDIYRDRPAPSYAEVVAANPRPLKPGAIVIFPEPPGGWSGVQR